ncbi:MAG: tetratricopeptide repeat protein [Pseudomonadota bacterium]
MSAVFVFLAGAAVIGAIAYIVRQAGASKAALPVVLAFSALSVLCYAFIGAPGQAGQPMSNRIADLAAKDPATLDPAEQLARLEQLIKDRPRDPEPHFFIGELLSSRGRFDDAARAYRSSLRRDGAFAPSLVALGDIQRRRLNGEIDETAIRYYQAAFQSDPEQSRAGFLAGLGLWRSGQIENARAVWDALLMTLPENSEERASVEAAIEEAQRRIENGAASP